MLGNVNYNFYLHHNKSGEKIDQITIKKCGEKDIEWYKAILTLANKSKIHKTDGEYLSNNQ